MDDIIVTDPRDAEIHMCSEITDYFNTMKWPVKTANKNSNIRRNVIGYKENCPIEAFVLGKVRAFHSPYKLCESTMNTKHKRLLHMLKKLMHTHDPMFKFNAIQLNKNVTTVGHYDKNNIGHSYCFALGNHTGGGMWIEKNGRKLKYRNRMKWVKYNGNKLFHGSLPVTSGTRYAIIFYRVLPIAKRPKTEGLVSTLLNLKGRLGVPARPRQGNVSRRRAHPAGPKS